MGRAHPPGWVVYLILLGLYLTLRGYHSFDGDQAYRLPLLLHRQDPSVFADDPFVRAFDAFNPHRGYLTLLDWAGRPFGLSFGLLALFGMTFALTCTGIDRLARAVWPQAGRWAGVIACVLFLSAKAGNIGTNHLFESMVLDRLIALSLGWVAMASWVERPSRGVWVVPPLLGLAAWVHPSVGLQLAMLFGATWVAWACFGPRDQGRWRPVLLGLAWLAIALAPSAASMAQQGKALFHGADRDEFALVTTSIQSPQHMIPHLWRSAQWLAWGCYLVLAALTLAGRKLPQPAHEGDSTPPEEASHSRLRLATLLGVNLAGLALAWVGIELVHDLRITIFQPFRMATVARGLCVVIVAGRVAGLWRERTWSGALRGTILLVGLTGDWSLVVATATELAFALTDRLGARVSRTAGLLAFGLGLAFLARHDTEAGHLRLLGFSGVALAVHLLSRRVTGFRWHPGRLVRLTALAWAVPVSAVVLPPALGDRAPGWVERLAEHCRVWERPVDEVERLAVWCRTHTPPDARFIGPPGPKTFRLWSRRSLAFNRAGSPYHASGLADWLARFREHVGFAGPTKEFVRAYLSDRQGLERRFDAMSPSELASLARRQGATYVFASADSGGGPLELLHIEGRHGVFRLRDPGIAIRPTATGDETTRDR